MTKSTAPIVYRGMTASQAAEAYDDTISIPNFYMLLQENRKRAKDIIDKLNPIQDIAYGNEAIQKLDIYAPKLAEKLPVLIDIHGGGWTAGSKNARSVPAEAIMSQNVIWVPIDYGLAPEYRIEDMIFHVRSAITWIYNNINQYGGDPNCLYISGQSAGAHLAATALMPGWHEDFGVSKRLLKGLIALSGIYDLDGLIYSSKTETQEILQLTTDEARRFSPFYHLQNSSIPSIIAYGDKEPLAYRREAEDFAKELETSGYNVSLIVVPDANHFNMINELANSKGILFNAVMKMIFSDHIL